MSTILIVEDDPWYAAQQQRVLGAAGYITKQASNPHAAMDLLDGELPDAIVVDVLLAYNTAFVLLHELQSSPETASIPVIVYTSQSDILQSTQLDAYGVVAVLDKTTMQPDDTARVLRRLDI